MAEISPFCALRFDTTGLAISNLVTQPYDKITPAMQERYYAASPYNLVRIILGKAQSDDDERNSVYTRAAGYLKEWRQRGILLQDDSPSLYVYTQRFQAPDGSSSSPWKERTGFIAAGQLHEYREGIVFRHEQTLAKPKADRLDLLRATKAHFGQIFMLYSDPEGAVDDLLKPAGPPEIEVVDEYGVQHRVWRVCHQKTLERVCALMRDKKLIIADGHHRYETALAYCKEQREPPCDGETGGSPRFDHAMMTFINMDRSGLLILPTHRVVHGLPAFQEQDFYRRIAEYFHVERLTPPPAPAAMLSRLRSAGESATALVAVTAEAAYLLRSRVESVDTALSHLPALHRKLDVVQLHTLLLEQVCGMTEESIRNQEHIQYVRNAAEAVQKVQQGGASMAFLMNPVRIEQMREVAFAGHVMPQKSTDFYPKLLSGLTIYALE
jgi:uncharacterized protein (DUF1015 family)